LSRVEQSWVEKFSKNGDRQKDRKTWAPHRDASHLKNNWLLFGQAELRKHLACCFAITLKTPVNSDIDVFILLWFNLWCDSVQHNWCSEEFSELIVINGLLYKICILFYLLMIENTTAVHCGAYTTTYCSQIYYP
jgi:hypothetical protein